MPKPLKHPPRCLVVRAPRIDTSYKVAGHYSAFVSHCTTPHHARPFETQIYTDDATNIEAGAYLFADSARWGIPQIEWKVAAAITVHEAEKAARTLRPIVRRLDQMTGEEGAPQSIGQSFARLARALNCSQLIVHDAETLAKDPSRTDGAWRIFFRNEWSLAIDAIDRQAAAIETKFDRRSRSITA